MKTELEIYEKLKDTVIEYTYKYLKYGICKEVKELKGKIKILCWVLNRMDLYNELPKDRMDLLILQKRLKKQNKQLKNLFGRFTVI